MIISNFMEIINEVANNMLNAIFSTVPDHRVTGRCTYSLPDLLTIALLTYLCGGEDYVDMSEFASERARDFGLLAGCGASPSPDTFERLMSAVSPDEIGRCLAEYGRTFLDTLSEKQVVLDGKKLRGVSPRLHGTHGDYLMNAFVSENQLFVGQVRLKDTENEITAVPQLLDKLDIEGAVVSIDAIGTQRDIADRILEKKGHYFLGVKDNQPGLRTAIEDAFRFSRPSDTASQMDCGHGRIETRDCRILPASAIEDGEVLSRWSGLKTIVEVTSSVDYGDRRTVSVRHYISDEDYPKAAITTCWRVDTGPSRTTCTGCWTSLSRRTRPEHAGDMPPRTCPTCANSHCRLSSSTTTSAASGNGCSGRHSRRTISKKFYLMPNFDAVALV